MRFSAQIYFLFFNLFKNSFVFVQVPPTGTKIEEEILFVVVNNSLYIIIH